MRTFPIRRGPRATLAAAMGISALALSSLGLACGSPEGNSENKPFASRDKPSSSAAESSRPPSPLYWGATIGPQITGTQAPYDMKAVARFEGKVGKRLSVVGFAAPFRDCSFGPCFSPSFSTSLFEVVRRHGAIPFFSWASHSVPGSINEPNFQLSDVINGRHDRYIRRFARGAKRWGHPFFLRFNLEMNGNWFPWSEQVNGNRRGEFVAAWRHVHRIFRSVGARNATWVWCPNVNINNGPGIQRNLRSLYPGNAYVDWTCLDGFNWGTSLGHLFWQTFSEVFRATYRQVVKIAPRKPMILGEVASTDRGGDKAAWIRNMLRTMPTRFRKIRGFVWYDVNDRGTGWPIETSRRVTKSFRRGIHRRIYRGNNFARLAPSPIQPPR